MRSTLHWLALAAALAAPLAQAAGESAGTVSPSDDLLRPFPAPSPSEPASALSGIGAELLLGEVGAVGFGLIGTAMAAEIDPPGLGRWMIGGLSVGAFLGTAVGNAMTGGRGNLLAASIGSMAIGGGLIGAGIVTSNLLGVDLSSFGPPMLVLALLAIPPVAAAVAGCVVFGRPSREYAVRVFPAISMTRDGGGAMTGIAGFF